MVDGPADEVAGEYMDAIVATGATRTWAEPTAAPGNGGVRLRSVRVRLEDGQMTDEVDMRHPVAIEMQYDVLEPGLVIIPSYQFFNKQGTCLFTSADLRRSSRQSPVGRYTSTCWIPGNLLAEGMTFTTAEIKSVDPHVTHVFEHHAVAFEVKNRIPSDPSLDSFSGEYLGMVRPALDWTTDVASLPSDAAILA
jgi:lipopolysaccharide transport system ATP-binding protein